MKIAYTGRQVELAPAQLKKLEARFAKIGKLLDGRRECEGHVILSLERHLHKAEVTVNYFGHQLAVAGSSADLFTAIHSAAEKLEKQAIKAREKWRDTKRAPRKAPAAEPPAAAARSEAKPKSKPEPKAKPKSRPKAEPEPEGEPEKLIYHVNQHDRRKPMTLDEAVLELDATKDYVVYRDAGTDRVSVLLRRRDGHFDLVED